MAEILRYHLQHAKQLELNDLTAALNALQLEYADFARRRGIPKSDAKLYVEKVSQGSLIVDLVELASVAVLPAMAEAVTVADFMLHLRDLYLYFTRKTTHRPENLTIEQCNNTSKLFSPLLNDPKGAINISVIGGDVNIVGDVFINTNATDANAVKNTSKEEAKQIKEQQPSLGTCTRTLLSVTQLNTNRSADRGKVQELAAHEVKLILRDEDKEYFVDGEINPLKTNYIVDVTPFFIGDRVTAYRVERVHEAYLDEP